MSSNISCADLQKHILEHEILLDETGSSNLTGIKLDGGRLWVYDEIRGKWLGTDRVYATAARDGRAKNLYLRLNDNQPSNLTGYRMLRKATILSIAAQTRNNETWTLQVRKNGTSSNLFSLPINDSPGAHSKVVNVDVDEGDVIQLFAETTTFLGIKDPFAMIEIAWRNDTLTL